MRPIAKLAAVASAALTLACLAPVPAQATPSSTTVTGSPTKVIYVGEENGGVLKAKRKMPWLTANANGKATGIRDEFVSPDRPSLPHYVVEGYGDANAFGITDDGAPSKHHLHGVTIFDNAIANGKTAKDYIQSATGNCPLTDTGTYQKVRHDGGAWAYDVDAVPRANCQKFAVPMESNLSKDVAAGTLPNVGWIGLDVSDDGHSPSTLTIADNYLKNTLIPLLKSGPDYANGDLVIVVGTDEASGSTDPNVLFDVFYPGLSSTVSTGMDQLAIYRMFMRYGGTNLSGQDALAGFGL